MTIKNNDDCIEKKKKKSEEQVRGGWVSGPQNRLVRKVKPAVFGEGEGGFGNISAFLRLMSWICAPESLGHFGRLGACPA